MAIIDADAHVIETDRTWDYFDETDLKYKPFTVTEPTDPTKEYWVFDGKLRAKRGNTGKDTTREAQEMLDIPARLRDMDKYGTDIQVLYPSLWTSLTFSSPQMEWAICKSYNRWMAGVWREGQGRLRWIAVLPAMSIDHAIDEMGFVKENGACGVTLRGFEGEYHATNAHFFPLYQEASKLNLPVCFHAGIGNASVDEYLTRAAGQGNFLRFKWPVLGAFHSLIIGRVPEKFPDLRWGFIEVSSQWLPYLIGDLARRIAWRQGRYDDDRPKGDLLKENRFYVACQTNDDIPYVLQVAGGEDNLVIGTDYGHADTTSELMAIRRFQEESGVAPAIVRKIVDDNARALYGLD